jgi:nicotinamide mononucleotide transporter
VIDTLFEATRAVTAALDPTEVLAVVLSVAYLVLAMRENRLCWYAALIGSALYVKLMWQAGLMMETGLQVYYVIMAAYGWWAWRDGGKSAGAVLRIHRWPWSKHALAIGVILVASILSGLVLSQFDTAQRPFADAFVTWASVLCTWMVARKLLENWLYWIVIDSIALALYVDRGLYPTALLFAAYVILAVCGWFEWWRLYREQQSPDSAESTA